MKWGRQAGVRRWVGKRVQYSARALQGTMVTNNSALGEAGGGAAGSGLGGGLFVQPACQGGAGCKSAFALLNDTLLDSNNASQVCTTRAVYSHHLGAPYCALCMCSCMCCERLRRRSCRNCLKHGTINAICGPQAGGGVYYAPDPTALASLTMLNGGVRSNSVPVGPETFGGKR
jgi:hypothetical protein